MIGSANPTDGTEAATASASKATTTVDRGVVIGLLPCSYPPVLQALRPRGDRGSRRAASRKPQRTKQMQLPAGEGPQKGATVDDACPGSRQPFVRGAASGRDRHVGWRQGSDRT